MCCHIRSASVSRLRRQRVQKPEAPPRLLAVLDLGKPGERQAHDFLLRATSQSDPMWTLLNVRRHGATLLCVVRWVRPERKSKPFSLAEVSLTETAVCWRDHASKGAALAELAQRCTVTEHQH